MEGVCVCAHIKEVSRRNQLATFLVSWRGSAVKAGKTPTSFEKPAVKKKIEANRRDLFTFRLGDGLVERAGDAQHAGRDVDAEEMRRAVEQDERRSGVERLVGRPVGEQAVHAGADGRGRREQQLNGRLVRRQHKAPGSA